MKQQRILSIDPSGTGTSGFYFTDGTAYQSLAYQSKYWQEHLTFISDLIKELNPTLLLYEDINYIHRKTKDGLSLFQLLGAIESLKHSFNLTIKTVSVLKVKQLGKQLLKFLQTLPHLTYQLGRGKGWMLQNSRISKHQLDAYIIYHLNHEQNNLL